jgi:N-acetylglucosamine-6-phosphate deacetylase
MKAFSNGKIFDGKRLLHNHAVIVDGEDIEAVLPAQEVANSMEMIDLAGGYLLPAFVDLQIYGGNGLLFAEYPSIASLQATYSYSLSGGASHILPTIATNSFQKIFEAIEAVRSYQEGGHPGVLGLHVEGPYINPVKKGAHVEAFIRKPAMKDVRELVEKSKGIIRIITLAPEVCTDDVLQYIQENDIIVSAGHSNATYEQAVDGFSKGIFAATHLYNAMSPLQHRAPGIVGAVFNTTSVSSSIVADGYHVDFAAIRIAKQLMQERLFYITDAVTENKTGIYPHHLDGEKYVVADGTLSGSALTMLKAVRNGIDYAGISLEESFRMASLYPWKLLGKDREYGLISKGYKASLLWLDDTFNIRGVYTQSALNRF